MSLFPKLSAILGLNNVGEVIVPPTGTPVVDWKIPDFFATLEHINSLDSPSFHFKNIPLKIKLFNGVRKHSKNFEKWFEVCLLHADDLSSMVHLIRKIGIKRNSGFEFKVIELQGETHGVHLLPISEFVRYRNELALEGYVTFFLEFKHQDGSIKNDTSLPSTPSVSVELSSTHSVSVELSSTPIVVSDRIGRSGLDTLSRNLKDLYLNQEHCDITIQVEERQFKSHKSILSARSPVFSKKIRDMAESDSGSLEVTFCKPETFHDFLLYLYSGYIETLSNSNVIGLYIVSNEYVVEDLKVECVDYMKSHISVEFYCDLVETATKYNEIELLDLTKDYFKKNTKKILMSTKWQSFLKEHSTIANELFLMTISDD